MLKPIVALGLLSALRPDPGLWDYTNLPTAELKQKYNFEVTQEWADHLRLSSVRFTRASGSFISSNGLTLTNHHVVEHHLSRLGLLSTGFLAANPNDERVLEGEKLLQLLEITDVTARVRASEDRGISAADKKSLRDREIAAIRAEVAAPFESEVVPLYEGGQYHLYKYKAYTDVRLVFAPEKKIAFFGGDGDNFEFPRYDLDMAIVRVYENGQPATTPNFLRIAANPVTEGDLIFVSGHPGSTQRLLPMSVLNFFKAQGVPLILDYLKSVEYMYQKYGQRGDAEARQVESDLFSAANSRKVYEGRMEALAGEALLRTKAAEEAELREAAAELEETRSDMAEYAGAWDRVARAYRDYGSFYKELEFFESATGLRRQIGAAPLAFQTPLFTLARQIVRIALERGYADKDRLPEYQGAKLDQLAQRLSTAPLSVDKKLESHRLAHALAFAVKHLGTNHALLNEVLAGQMPRERAYALVRGTRLLRTGVRAELIAGGIDAIKASTDPMIQLALLVESKARELRLAFENRVSPDATLGLSQLARLRFEVGARGLYPDATFTLRLSYGAVRGYRSSVGEQVPWKTTIGDTFRHADRHGNRGDWELPESWTSRRAELESNTTPFNFVSTADIIGGNSGSPVTNRNGELVGLIFDGNIESLPNAYLYNEDPDRAVSVHLSGILEVMRTIYGAGALVDQLGR